MANVRSDTTKRKFSTLPIGLYESEAPPNVDYNFLSFFRREANTQDTKEKVIFYKGSVFVRTEEEDMLIVTNEDIYMAVHVPIEYLQKSSRKTEKTAYSSTGKAPRLWTLNPVLQLHFPHFQCKQGHRLLIVSG